MRSLPSVRIISDNNALVLQAASEYATRLKQRPEVKAVYLCGSRAKRTHTPFSDADILVLIDRDSRRPGDRSPEYMPDRFPVGVDLFVYTEEEAKARPFVQQLLFEAIEL